MFYIFYNIASLILFPLHLVVMLIRIFLRKEKISSMKQRFVISSKKRPTGTLIWLHAASVGESMVALTLIKALNKSYHGVSFLLTSGTLSSASIIKKWQPDNCIHQYTPIDNPLIVKIFLNKWKPDLSIFIESELWPSLIQQASKLCKVILVNARLSDKSYFKWQKIRNIFGDIVNHFSIVLAQSSFDADKFRKLGIAPEKVLDLGNLKFSNEELKVNKHNLQELKAFAGERKVFVAASTHAEDEDIVIAAIKKLYRAKIKFFPVIVLRHPERREEIASLCKYYNLQYSFRSQKKVPDKKDQIYIIDSFGELGTFYSLADIAFVGGSFKRGGHNLVEPAYFDCPIIIGPDMTNFYEIATEMLEAKAAIQVQDQKELEEKIVFLFGDDGRILSKNLRKNALEYVKDRQEIIDQYVNEITKIFPPSR